MLGIGAEMTFQHASLTSIHTNNWERFSTSFALKRHSQIACTVRSKSENGNGSYKEISSNNGDYESSLKTSRETTFSEAKIPSISDSSSTKSKDERYGWKPLGDDPFRMVDGKKVYVDEIDIFGFLESYYNLTPLEPDKFNAAAYLWKKISDIPEERRHRLFNFLEPRHINLMWEISGTRYDDEEQFLENAIDMLPDGRLDDSFQPQIWDGRIGGLPNFLGWLADFQKVFFVGKDEKTYGYVISGGPLLSGLATWISPLYYQVKPARSIKSARHEMCDASFDFTDGQRHLIEDGLPADFPLPKNPVFPFSNDTRDYLRAAGPGVLIGQSWNEGPDRASQIFGDYILIKKSNKKWVEEDGSVIS